MPQMQVTTGKDISKKTGKQFTYYQIAVTDNNGDEFISDYLFPRWRRAQGGVPLPTQPVI